MKPTNQLFRGSLFTITLKLLSERGKMYGYEITSKVKERTGGELTLTEGSQYPGLHKIEEEELLEATIENIGNRARKYYHLPQKGSREVLSKLAETYAYLRQMHAVLNLSLFTKK